MKKIKNISIGVFICESKKKDCDVLKNTFLKHFENFLFFGATEDLSMPCYTHEKVEGDDYNSALSKHFLCLKKQFDMHPDCEWFYIGGTDIFLHPDNVQQLLEKINPQAEIYIGGHCDKRVINGLEVWFGSGGPGYFISKQLLEKMYPRLEQYIEEWKHIYQHGEHCIYAGCDVATAYFLKTDFNISVTKCEGFYHFNYDAYYNANKNQYPEGYHLYFELITHPIAFHNLNPVSAIEDLYDRAKKSMMPFQSCKELIL
jgi:hypothetical protein